ncbi:hypothetical protein RchiOBHm_Chr5g0002981 [Rosa chinensis]|uniref:Uncharacterized protein n=1 Tax=Rosa chinensis TaxID=74649 RepID=A0A2P6Q2N5_ROSCH|nr:hypothetical protein RchiOBHm_Chr5g0002981 [Rosa chinensis]
MFSTPFILSFALLLSLPLLFLLAPYFLPHNNQILIPTADEIDYQALFAHVVLSKSTFTRLSFDPKTKPKIAFLFLTNFDLHFAPYDTFLSTPSATSTASSSSPPLLISPNPQLSPTPS